MAPSSILITGCNRGIGLELVHQLLSSPSPPTCLIATYRSPATATALLALAKSAPSVHALLLDVADVPSHPAFVAQVTDLVGDAGLNLLINNAGMNPKKDLESVTPEDMVAAFSTNCVAPLFLSRALLPLLQRAADRKPAGGLATSRAAIVQVSSILASIGEVAATAATGATGLPAYRCSKAALNMSTAVLAVSLLPRGVLCASLHPGWVQTDMGGQDAPVTVQASVAGMLATMDQLGEKDHGALLSYDNKPIQW